MKNVSCIVGIALSFFAAGCAIHPLPQDVTGVDTYHIVRQIRCEAHETIRLEVINWMKKLAAAGDPLAEQLALQYESAPDSISRFRPELFTGRDRVLIKSVAKLFFDTGIAYTFQLTMTEDNNLMTGLSFLKPFTEPVFTLGVNANADRTRTNIRTFTVTDTFGHLLTKLNTEVRGVRYCDGQLVAANYVYPIAGRIGIDRMVRDFIELTLFANLVEPGAAAGTAGAPTMVDQLTFTTNIGGSLNPMVVFTPVTHAFQLTNASLTARADRMDTHQVTVGLAVAAGDVSQVDPIRSFLFSRDRGASTATSTANRGASSVLVGRRITGAGRTPSELLAVLAVDQFKSRELQLTPTP